MISRRNVVHNSRSVRLLGGALFGLLGAVSCAQSQPLPQAQPIVLPANAPVLKTEVVSTPVHAARSWSTALAPNARGGWNFITQLYQVGSEKPAEYVVLDLQSGKYTVTEGRVGGYTNSNYQWQTQARAANGRIFFSEAGSFVTYYDPKDEKIHDLGQVADPKIHTMIYRWVFGPDGKLYGGSQANGKNRPAIVQIDPDTLKYRLVGTVGQERNAPNYAYYMAIDPTPSEGAPQGWIYVAVGQNPWELSALNTATGEQKILWKATDAWIDGFNMMPVGIRTGLATNMSKPDQRKKDFFWLADGQMYPCDTSKGNAPTDLPFKPRKLEPIGATEAPEGAPEVDLSQLSADGNGIGRVFWRPAGSKEEFKEAQFKVKYTMPIALESLLALPDNTLLGNAVQYQGFFRYDPKTRKSTFYGAHGPSRGPRVVVGDKVYISGYPNGVTYLYDPQKPWTSNRRMEDMAEKGTLSEAQLADLNPRKLGTFADAGAHYSYFLIPSQNGRIYFGGRRERNGTGGGVGWYDPKTNTFGGHHKDLSFLTPRGMVVLDGMQRIVYSGELGNDPTQPDKKPAEAQLVVYDMDLNELERITLKPGMKNTGLLFAGRGNEFIGISEEDGVLYRYDLKAKKVLDWKTLPEGGVGNNSFVRRADGMWWGIMGGQLVRLDPSNLEIKSFGKFETAPSLLAWVGNELYGTSGPDLLKITLPAS